MRLKKFLFKIIAGPAGRRQNAIQPFEGLPPERMVNECSVRGIYTAETKVKPTKKNLEPMLKQDLKGVIRPPALCYGDVMETMDSLNLGMYEVSFLSKTLLRSTLWNGFPTEIKTVNSILPFRKKPFILLLHLRTCSKPDTIFTVLV